MLHKLLLLAHAYSSFSGIMYGGGSERVPEREPASLSEHAGEGPRNQLRVPLPYCPPWGIIINSYLPSARGHQK